VRTRASARQRGSALLAVLWLSAALAAIAFALSTTVRSETERTSTAVDGLRSYYLASGAVYRAAVEMQWSLGANNPMIPKGVPFVDYHFASGDVHVEIIPEAAKLDVNRVPVELLDRVLLALGVDPERAQEVAEAIDDWRRPATDGPLDGYYLSLTPSFKARHASLEETEELLLVKGVTPDLFYGTYIPAEGEVRPGAPRLVRRTGLADCLSVYGAPDRVDANTADPAVMAALGVSPYAITALLERRQVLPALTQDQLGGLLESFGADASHLRIGGNSMFTLRATARLRLENGQFSDLRRSVAAQVKYFPNGFHILRWYNTAWSN
jgi:general secretion pathway protein K